MTQLDPVEIQVPTGVVRGSVAPAFRPVLDAFIANFNERRECGAGVCLLHEGEIVVDLLGGSADPRADRVWDEETLIGVFSCTKGALAFVANRLAERGVLDLDAPVTELWPEYGAHGKDKTTTRMMLDHTAGVPAFRDPVPDGKAVDWDYMTGRLAAQEPFFEPGTRSSYHAVTYAWTVGEMIRRAAGKPAGAVFAEDFAGPLELDFYIGLPEAEDHRVGRILAARLEPGQAMPAFAKVAMEKGTIPNLAFFNDGGFTPNKREYRAVEIGSANGVTNARSLARLYAPASLFGQFEGQTYFSPQTIAQMQGTTNASHWDASLHLPMRFGPGFMHSVSPHNAAGGITSYQLSETAFGHCGAGGSVGFADPQAGLAFGYVMNQMGLGQLLNARGQSLVDAAYRALELM